MNPLYITTPAQRSSVREQYLSSLQLQIENDQKNLNANKILKYTGETPTQITDTRTTEEKFADMQSTRRDVKNFIVSAGYLTPSNANIFIDRASDGIIQFIYRNKNFILRDYLSKGVTPTMFNDFIEGYIAKYNRGAGIDMGIQSGYFGQAPVISNNQILNRLIRQVDLDNLQLTIENISTELSSSFTPSQFNLIERVYESIVRLRPRIITDEEIRQIDTLSQADQSTIRSLLSDSYKDLPVREQLIVKQNELNDALQRRNIDRIIGVLIQINDLIDIGEGRAQQIDEILAAVAEEATEETTEEEPQATTIDVDAETLERLRGYYNSINLIEQIGARRNTLRNFLSDTGLDAGLRATENLDSIRVNVGGLINKSKQKKLNFINLKEKTNWEELTQTYINEKAVLGEDIIGRMYKPNSNTFRDDEDAAIADIQIVPNRVISGDDGQLMSGVGISKRSEKRSEKEKFKKKVEVVADKPKPYISFGKHYINKQKLNDDILQIKGDSGANANFKTRRISPTLKAVFKSLLENKTPDFTLISKLSKIDKETLYEAISITKYDKISIDPPSKTEDEKLANEFEILRGSILSGNDNPQTIKRFKLLLVRLMNSKRIPRGEANDILFELAQLGF